MSEQMTAVSAVLEDGGQVNIRQANAGDESALAAFYARLGVHDGHLWSPRGRSAAAGAAHEAAVPVPIGQSVTAWANDELIGVADYRTLGSTREAEVTVAITGRWRGRGIETLLLEHLISSARQQGIESFHADVQADNSEMLLVLANLGLPGQPREPSGALPGHANRGLLGSRRRRSGSVAFDLSLRYDERYLQAVAERESRADVFSLRRVFAPRSVAIVGASRREASVGNAVVRHLLEADFHGPVYPVNPHTDRIAGLCAYPSVSALPEVPDLVVVAVPAPAVAGVAEECGQCGVGGLVVLSAGFSDLDAGRLRQAVRHYGMRMVGPNCIGIANTDPAVALDATFTRQIAAPGPVGVLTQSGGIGFAISESLHGAGLGVSTFASVGNKYDVSGNDLLLWWRHDDRTKVAIIYLESFGNPRKFARLARQLGRRIPVVVIRVGASEVAQQAARSHTAATATPAVIRDELFRQAGVVATDDLAEAIDAVAFFSWQPLPAGRRVALVCNTGGAGVLAADACARYGLQVPPLSPATQETLAAILPDAGGAVTNPVDTTAGVSAELFGRVLQIVAADPGIDAIVPILTPTAVSPTEQILDSLIVQTPVAAVLLGQREALTLHGRVPVYSSATAAIRALSHAADYAATRSREPGTVPEVAGIDKDAAEVAIGTYLTEYPQGGWLDGAVLDAVARAYGLPAAPSMIAHDAEEAADALIAFGGRVAMKALASGLVHRSDEHAVVLDVQTADEARSAYRRLAAKFGDRLSGVLVQQMIPPGTEMLVGFVRDPVFGPLVQVGAGGVTTDLVKDRAARLLPLTDRDARDMIGSLRMAPLLTGFRDAPPLDVAALTDVLHRVARLAADLPSVAELDINPLILCPSGCTGVDTKIRVVPAHVIDPYLRELR
jgi:acyl-CoA synthetase (NDP forming)/N-acetylglutamate synthase-like GNAT family acetyltransferase